MLYIDNEECKEYLADNNQCMNMINDVIEHKKKGEYFQPIKPYLEFPDKDNRIIAMPAFVGGQLDLCGIKWISSFPKNIGLGFPRASCITILNSTRTGKPYCIINSAYLSICRTAALSGVIVKNYINKAYPLNKKYVVGIIGYGPIGVKHKEIVMDIMGDRLNNIIIYDEKKCEYSNDKITIGTSWKDVCEKSDIIITSTNAKNPYINKFPTKGKLILNISLRDFVIENINMDNVILIVDDWEEINRKNTNVENLFKAQKIQKKDCISINKFLGLDLKNATEKVYFFNPMGLAIFDIAIAKLAYKNAIESRVEA